MNRTIEIFLQAPEEGRTGFNRLSEETIVHLKEKFPEFASWQSAIKAREIEGSDRLRELISELWRCGKRPVVCGSLMLSKDTISGETYSVTPMQYAEPQDLLSGRYVQLRHAPENGIGRITRLRLEDGSSIFALSSEKLRLAKRFGYLNENVFGCSETFREDLEAQGFIGIAFSDPPLHPNPTYHPSTKLQVLTSSITLPPVKNGLCAYRDLDSDDRGVQPFSETDGSLGCFISPEYRPPILRFDAAAVEELGDFDIARTSECFGSPTVYPRPKFVVSQRFRQWLDAQGLDCGYHPIRLENPGDPEPDPPLATTCRELDMPLANVPG